MVRAAVYCRVSTDKQELDQQTAACLAYCSHKGLTPTQTYAEIGSGRNFARPEFQKMLKAAREYSFDAVVVFRFDRLGRNSRELVLLFDEFDSKGIAIHSLHESFDTTTPIGRAMREIIATLAQLEREQIGEATKQRLAALKALGKKLGRKPRRLDEGKARAMREAGKSWRHIAMALGCPQSTLRLHLSVQQSSPAKNPGAVPLQPPTAQESANTAPRVSLKNA